MFSIVMRLDTFQLICFKLDMMIDSTKLYSLIPVWMTLMSTQCQRVTGKLELVGHFVVKLHEATQMLMMADYVRKMTVRSPVSIANMNCLSIYSSCCNLFAEYIIVMSEYSL